MKNTKEKTPGTEPKRARGRPSNAARAERGEVVPSIDKRGADAMDLKAVTRLARRYVPDAIQTLAEIMVHGSNDTARLAAANAILDRAVGRAKQVLDVGEDVTKFTGIAVTFIGEQGDKE